MDSNFCVRIIVMDKSEEELKKIIEKLQSKKEVDAVFLTGSGGNSPLKPWSDIDLVVVFKRNTKQLYSLFTWIGGRFADVFFYDLGDIARLGNLKSFNEDNLDGTFVDWLRNGKIEFDKSGRTTRFKNEILRRKTRYSISPDKVFSSWQSVNYNYVANNRYFSAKDPAYHKALELRLLYSAIELVTAYFTLRGIPWRGEKKAVKYLEERDKKYYAVLIRYFAARDLKARMGLYNKMVSMTLTKKYGVFPKSKVIAVARKDPRIRLTALAEYWKKLIS